MWPLNPFLLGNNLQCYQEEVKTWERRLCDQIPLKPLWHLQNIVSPEELDMMPATQINRHSFTVFASFGTLSLEIYMNELHFILHQWPNKLEREPPKGKYRKFTMILNSILAGVARLIDEICIKIISLNFSFSVQHFFCEPENCLQRDFRLKTLS